MSPGKSPVGKQSQLGAFSINSITSEVSDLTLSRTARLDSNARLNRVLRAQVQSGSSYPKKKKKTNLYLLLLNNFFSMMILSGFLCYRLQQQRREWDAPVPILFKIQHHPRRRAQIQPTTRRGSCSPDVSAGNRRQRLKIATHRSSRGRQ